MDLIPPYEMDINHKDPQVRQRNSAVWDTLNAARDGNLPRLRKLISAHPALVDAQFWYVAPLHFAVREGHIDAVEFLIASGADLTLQTLYGAETYLQTAMDRNHEEVVACLRTALRQQMSSEGDNHPIHQAAAQGDMDAIQRFIEKDREIIDRGDAVGRRPIHYAVENQQTNLIKFLIEKGAQGDAFGFSSDNRLGGYGFRPVALALWHHPYWKQRNDYVTARLLLEAGAAYSITIAAALGDINRVQELLNRDPNIANDPESCGKRALSAAAERNHGDIVKLLLDAGADPNLSEGRNCPRGYALWAAAHLGYRDIAEALLKAGADPNADVESSGTPTESAIDKDMRSLCYLHGGQVRMLQTFFEGNIDTIAALLQHAPHVFTESVAIDGFTHGVSSNHEAIVQLLLDHGVRVPPHVTGCQTYLWHNLHLTKKLLDAGMDPNLPNWQHVTPLHHMARSNQIEAAKLFLEYGADPNQVDEDYRSTPLGWAAKSGQIEYVKLLLDRDPESRQQQPPEVPNWAYPLAWAKRRNHTAIVELLASQ